MVNGNVGWNYISEVQFVCLFVPFFLSFNGDKIPTSLGSYEAEGR